MERVAAGLRRTLLGLWFGSVCCFSFLVAPTLFRVIRAAPPDRASPAPNALAGDVVVPTLQALAWLGLVLGTVVALLLMVDPQKKHLRLRLLGVGLGLLSVVISMVWLTPTGNIEQDMAAIREAYRGRHGKNPALEGEIRFRE